ncbi:MAG: hypothetical protein COT18_10505, partial [Elusimicrobia bacterium CG08_land_8_20_14_0_20_59_10]
MLAAFSCPAGAAVSKTSKRIIRAGVSASDFSAAALSTTSIQWSWSTGTFTDPGITEYRLYTASAVVVESEYWPLNPGTTYHIDTGLGVNKVYTRWLRVYKGATPDSDSEHIEKYTYALPPGSFTLNSVTAESAYITWTFSEATAYAVECSSTAGASYVRIRDIFVPWQTITLLSNKDYQIRLGAVNGDNELTPGLYSSILSTTTPPLDMTMTGVALSSYAIQWQWSTGPFTGTGITDYRIYRSTLAPTGELPADEDAGEILLTTDPAVNSWTETFVDLTTETWSVETGSVTSVIEYAANTRRTRWMKAVGILGGESAGRTPYRKYTYATAPATAAVGGFGETVMSIEAGGPFRASNFAVDYATGPADFAVFFSSVTGTNVSGLTGNTKYDFRLGAINGDEELTPYHFSYATSAVLRAMTMPAPPYAFAAAPYTDTTLNFSWSTSTYLTPSYIDGYYIGIDCYIPPPIDMWTICQVAFVPGATTNLYGLDYLYPNSTHKRYVKASQTDPAWVASHPSWPDPAWEYQHIGSDYTAPATNTTFATPPNDVSFYSVRSSTVGLVWNEPVVPATKYRVERSTSGAGPEDQRPWVFVSSVTGNTAQDTGLAPSTTYYYRIGAINIMGILTKGLPEATTGYRRDYSFVSSTITKHISPTLFGVATGTQAITWSWTNTVPGVLSYNFYTANDALLAAGAATPYYETYLSSANARYTRRVRSVTAIGEGDYSEASVSTLANPPVEPVITSSGVHALSLGWAANGSAGYSVARSPDMVLWPPGDVFVSANAYLNDTRLRFATTYYYAVHGINDDGFVSLSSAVTAANMTLPLPSTYTTVFATAAVSLDVTAPLAGLGADGRIRVEIPVGTPDGYFAISTSAATSPLEISTNSLAAAAAKLVNSTLLNIVELRLYDVYGSPLTADFSSPVRIMITYTDANNDDMVDATSPQIPVDTLKLFNLDTTALVWNQIKDSTWSKSARYIYADIPHFSFYALGSVGSVAGLLADVFAYPNPYRPGSG